MKRRRTEEPEDENQINAPLCPGHNLPALLQTVRKVSPNTGTHYYTLMSTVLIYR